MTLVIDFFIFSVIPTQCTYSGVNGTKSLTVKDDVARRFFKLIFAEISVNENMFMYFLFRRKESEDRKNAWDDFVGSIRSKLTVKQVVDGVRSGGDLTFDYICLVLTAE